MKYSLQDLKLKGQKILMRVDFNVPIDDDGSVRDDTRIRLALPSIEYVMSQGGRLILISHFKRPNGKKDPKLSLKPVADYLSKLLGNPVPLAPDCIGPEVEKMVDKMQNGDVLLLENVRFYMGEEHPEKDPEFEKNLAKLGNIYVNDAFGAAHRKHTSTALLAHHFPEKNALGFLMEKEVSFFSKLIRNPKRPFYAIIGGAKVGTKIGVLQALTDTIDAIFIGGGMAFTFMKSQGLSIGDSLCEDEHLETAQSFLKTCAEKAIQVYFPTDYIIASEFSNDAKRQIASAKEGIPATWRGMDIGPDTIEYWKKVLKQGSTIFWNGPMGVFEFSHFAEGTHSLAIMLADLDSTVVVGGGDSVAAINAMGLQKSFTHVSSGGGAALEFIEFGHLPGLDALTDR